MTFDGEWETLGAEEIKSLSGSSVRSLVVGPASDTFPIPGGRPWVLLSAEWDNTGDGVSIQLQAPDGTIFDESAIQARADMALVDELTGPHKRTVVVLNPDAGDWTLTIPAATGLGQVRFAALLGSQAPTVEITGPAQDALSDLVDIEYLANDPDSVARVTLFYDDDRRGFDGLIITGDLVEADGPGVFSWSPSAGGVAAGDYYVYAMIEDEHNPPAFSGYSTGRVRIIDPNSPAAVTGIDARWLGSGSAGLSWSPVPGADSYLISYTANAAGAGYTGSATTRGVETSAVVDGLIRGETYRLQVQAVVVNTGDGTGILGQRGDPATTVMAPYPTVAPATGEWPVFADPGTLYQAVALLGSEDSATLLAGPVGSTVNVGSGLFQWQVPDTADGWYEVLVKIDRNPGTADLVRYHLLADPSRTGNIAGHAFYDSNGDGSINAGEATLEGWTVQLLDAITGELLDGAITTADQGTGDARYEFAAVTPGDYGLRQVPMEGWYQVFPASLPPYPIKIDGGADTHFDFGNRLFGNADGDGLITAADVMPVAFTLGSSSPPGAAIDFNGDGVTDVLDLAGLGVLL